jgi:hypothetical protein
MAPPTGPSGSCPESYTHCTDSAQNFVQIAHEKRAYGQGANRFVRHHNNAIGCLAPFEERDLIFHQFVTLAKPVLVAQVTQGKKAYGMSDTRPSAYPVVGVLGTNFPWKS